MTIVFLPYIKLAALVEQIKIRFTLRLTSSVRIVLLQTAAAAANYREWQQHLPLI